VSPDSETGPVECLHLGPRGDFLYLGALDEAGIVIDLDELHATGETRIKGFHHHLYDGHVPREAMGTVPPKAGPDIYL
jgi:hypothetical protein